LCLLIRPVFMHYVIPVLLQQFVLMATPCGLVGGPTAWMEGVLTLREICHVCRLTRNSGIAGNSFTRKAADSKLPPLPAMLYL